MRNNFNIPRKLIVSGVAGKLALWGAWFCRTVADEMEGLLIWGLLTGLAVGLMYGLGWMDGRDWHEQSTQEFDRDATGD